VLNIGPSFARQQYPGVQGIGLQALMCGIEAGNKNPEIQRNINMEIQQNCKLEIQGFVIKQQTGIL